MLRMPPTIPKEQRTEMPFYENVFIARQEGSSQQVDAMIEEFTKLISENGGEVPKSEYWGVRGLAYRIKKNRKGHYVLMNIECDGKKLTELNNMFKSMLPSFLCASNIPSIVPGIPIAKLPYVLNESIIKPSSSKYISLVDHMGSFSRKYKA